MKCVIIPPIFNGAYEILPYNKFGATVRYTCNEGYILSGPAERRCQGNTQWSDKAPTCETEGEAGRWGRGDSLHGGRGYGDR